MAEQSQKARKEFVYSHDCPYSERTSYTKVKECKL